MNTSPIYCKVNNVFIHVSNLEKSSEWYSDLHWTITHLTQSLNEIPLTTFYLIFMFQILMKRMNLLKTKGLQLLEK